MKSFNALVLIPLFAISFTCDVLAFSRHASAPAPEPSAVVSVTPSPVVTFSPVPYPSASPLPARRIHVANITGASADEREMIRKGEALVNAMLDKPCFKQWVLAAHYTENEDLTQAQILDRVETQPSSINVEMYTGTWWENHKAKTVGYENDPFDGVVHMNRYFVNLGADVENGMVPGSMVADNLIHEDRGHSLGFHHYENHATSEPYGMNYAFEGCSVQAMQARGAKAYHPPGLRIRIKRHRPTMKKRHAKKAA